MPYVKILYVADVYEDYYNHSYVTDTLDWEEISEDDLKLLVRNKEDIPKYMGYSAVLVIKNENEVKPTLAHIKVLVVDRARKREEAERIRAEKRAALAERRKVTQAKKLRKMLEEKKRELAQLEHEIEKT